MLSVIPCDTCGGTLETVPGLGLLCANGCSFDRLGKVVSPEPSLAPPQIEPLEATPADLRPRWRPCGHVRTPENYLTRTSGGVTYSGCRDCWEGMAS